MLSAVLASGQPPAPAASTARISGRVVAEGDHTPLVGAHVTLIPFKLMAGPFGPALQAVTDQDGRYVFENLAPGSYRIQAQRPGFAIRTDFMTMRALDVTAGQKLDNADIELTRGGAIAGRIVDPFGEPLAEVNVMVMRRVEREGSEPQLAPGGGQGQQTNDLGEFRIYGLASGTYLSRRRRGPLHSAPWAYHPPQVQAAAPRSRPPSTLGREISQARKRSRSQRATPPPTSRS